MIICIAGKNRIAVEALNYIIENHPDYEIQVCINNTDNGINNWQPSLKYYCKKNNIKIISLDQAYELNDSVFISLEFDRIVNPKKFKHTNIYNIHFSLLPAYKGMYTSILPILYGEEISGVTLHYMDSGIDTGNILYQESFEIGLDDNSRDIYEKYLTLGTLILKNNIEHIISGQIKAKEQSIFGSSYYSKKTISFSDIKIDLNKTAIEIHNQIRAYSFREYQLPCIFGLPIYKSLLINQKSKGKSGTIIFQDDYKILLNTIDYQIELYIDKLSELTKAAETGDIKVIKEITSMGYPVKTRTKQGWDIFIIACYFNQSELVQYLLDNEWDVNTANYKGTTALMYAMTVASQTNNLEVLQILKEQGKINWKLKDDKGRDVFSYAIEYENSKVINFMNSVLK